MTEETPGKVLGLLVTACVSMLLLFLVSYSNMSFSGSEAPVPDPFAPQHVVAMLDNAAASYSGFLAQNLFQPAKSDYAYWSDSVGWVWDNSKPALASMAGLDLPPAGSTAGQVAGAFTTTVSPPAAPSGGGLNVDTLYSILIR